MDRSVGHLAPDDRLVHHENQAHVRHHVEQVGPEAAVETFEALAPQDGGCGCPDLVGGATRGLLAGSHVLARIGQERGDHLGACARR